MAELETELGNIQLPDKEAQFIDFKAYRGNNLLKKAGVRVKWTPDLIKDFTACKKSPQHFIEKYIKVISLDDGLVSMKLRDYQVKLVDNIHKNRYTITTMARQSGKSSAVTAYLLWYILFNSHKTVLLMANKADTAREILGKAQMAYMHLPKHIQQGIVEGGWNKGSMEFENGSRALALATGDASARGYSANMLILDETAHIENWEDFSKSTLPIVSSGKTTKIVMISTPSGLNHFWSYWHRAQFHDTPKDRLPPGIKWNGYIPLLVTWRQVPGRDDKWLEETMQQLNHDQAKFDQEYECSFMGSSGTLIAGWKIKELSPSIPEYDKDGLKKYVDPVPNHQYALVADTSEGKGFDYSAFSVFDVTQMPYVQVTTFRSNIITPADYAEIIYRVANAYNDAMILGEFTSLWPEVVHCLMNEYEYENILKTESAGSLGKRLSFDYGKGIDRGLKTSVTSKAQGCAQLKLLIEQNQLIIKDFDTIEEIARFVKTKNSYAAEEGWHDDLVMGLVLFAWLAKQERFQTLTEVNVNAHLRDYTSQDIEAQVLPAGFSTSSEAIIEEQIVSPTDLWLAQKHPIRQHLLPTIGWSFAEDEEDGLPNHLFRIPT